MTEQKITLDGSLFGDPIRVSGGSSSLGSAIGGLAIMTGLIEVADAISKLNL